LAVVSENGYLFVWNILTKELKFSSKIHNGSIEALSWRGDTLTCSASDCTFSVVTFKA
jgi:WD40 repeat protein